MNNRGTENDESRPDHIFDGGEMDCGSGLILLIRQNMLQVPAGGVLEILSTEPTVTSELPPWCRMAGHVHLQSTEVNSGQWRHRVRRGEDVGSEAAELKSDEDKAKSFQWRLRARRSSRNTTTVYSRSLSWKTGASIDFDKSGENPSAVELLLGALLSDVISTFAVRCSQTSIAIDDLEATVNGTLHNSLAALGIEAGDSSLASIALVMYVTSPAPEHDLRDAWEKSLGCAPVAQTLLKACEIDSRLVLL